MNRPENWIPDDMASEVLAEAARLTMGMESSQGYFLKELEQAGSEVQISPEAIRQAVEIVAEKRRTEQVKRQQARERFKQQIKQYAPVGVVLRISLASISGILILLSIIGKLMELSNLQSQVQALENEKQQIQVKLDQANQQLKLKDTEVDQLRRSNDRTLEKLHNLQQETRISKSLEVDPKTGIMFRDSFTKVVIRQTKYQVIQAVGKPDRTSDSGEYSYWYYDNKTKDRITGNLDRSICILFVNGIVDKVDSNYY
ncbi:hypothetical protein IFO70_34890 [Phormidium tenue FACHB-886]|nr:hypothetical protein [Phormidium tenue FACHB-886]